MGRKKKKAKKRTTPFKSNALLPARKPGEPAILPFRIKTEKDKDMQNDDVRERAEDLKDSIDNPWVCPSDESTVSQPREFHQEILLQNNSNYHVKKEPTDSAPQMNSSTNGHPYILTQNAQNVCFNKESSVTSVNSEEWRVSIYNEKSPLKRKLGIEEAPKVIRKKIKIIPVDDDQNLFDQAKDNQAANISSVQNIENRDTNIYSEHISEASKPDNDAADQAKKVAVDNVKNSQGIKEARLEDDDDIFILSVLKVGESIHGNVKEKNADNDKNFQEIQEASNVNDDVVVLSVSKGKKSVPEVIVLDAIKDQDSGFRNLAVKKPDKKLSSTSLRSLTSTFSTNTDKERNFSIDISRPFNAVSELDRYDCQSALDYVSEKWIHHSKTERTFQKYFPLVRTERKSREIVKGDILFKTRITHSKLIF